jgi:hypothetical protein
MHQSAVEQHRLSAYARRSRLKIRERQARAIFAALGEVSLFPQGVSHLLDARCEMPSDDFPKSRKRHVVEDIRTAFGGGVKQLTEICKSGGIDVRDGPVFGAAVAPDLNRIAACTAEL